MHERQTILLWEHEPMWIGVPREGGARIGDWGKLRGVGSSRCQLLRELVIEQIMQLFLRSGKFSIGSGTGEGGGQGE